MRVARSTQSVSCNISRLNKIHLIKFLHTYTFLVLFKAQKYTCKRLFFSFLGIVFIPVKLLFILCISEVRCGYKNVPRHPEMAEIQPLDDQRNNCGKRIIICQFSRQTRCEIFHQQDHFLPSIRGEFFK